MISSKKTKRVISIGILALLNISVMASLRNLALVAQLGYEMISFFAVAALFFLIPSALVSAELATGWAKSGGIYIWVREALGERWAFFSVWMQWVHNVTWYPAILSFVAGTLAYLFNPELVRNKIFMQSVVLIIFWGMSLVNYLGIRVSSAVSTLGTLVGTIGPGLFIIILAGRWIIAGNPVQISFSFGRLLPDLHHLEKVAFLAGFFLAFSGLEVSAGYAGEVERPRKNYPRAIFFAALTTFVLFVLGAMSIAIVVPRGEVSLVVGLMEALDLYLTAFDLRWVIPVLGLLLIFGAVAEMNSWIMGPIKAIYTTSVYGNLPPFFQNLNRRGMPTHLLLFQAIVVTIASFVILYMPTIGVAYWVLSAISAQMYLMMYLLMFVSAVRLRYSHPRVLRPYKIPYSNKGMWVMASLGFVSSLFGIVVGFVPPVALGIGDLFVYEAFLIVSLMIMSAIPLLIFQCRKPHWIKRGESA